VGFVFGAGVELSLGAHEGHVGRQPVDVVGVGVSFKQILGDAVGFIDQALIARDSQVDLRQPRGGLPPFRPVFLEQFLGAAQRRDRRRQLAQLQLRQTQPEVGLPETHVLL